MRNRVETTTINGWNVATIKLAPLRGLELKATVAKLALPMIGKVAPFIKELEAEWRAANPDAEPDAQFEIKINEIDPERAAPVLVGLAEHIEPKSLPGLVSDILKTTSVTRNDPDNDDSAQLIKFDLCDPGAIDRVFGDVSDLVMWSVVWHALRAQFADFFGGSKPGRASPPTPTP